MTNTAQKISHTPGAWRYYKQGDGTRFIVTARAVGTPGNSREDFATVDIQHEANARLIAAAPAMYAALLEISEKATGTNPDFRMADVRRVARAAIAKVQS